WITGKFGILVTICVKGKAGYYCIGNVAIRITGKLGICITGKVGISVIILAKGKVGVYIIGNA
ncbi:hypothetical protein, partial [Escherichia coli]|uniref:hypothetical protein n=1 Tax=Escherichia coli TaxID=562 RepID=UPI001BDB985E